MNVRRISYYTACGLAALVFATQALPRHMTIERATLIDAAPEAVIELAASNIG